MQIFYYFVGNHPILAYAVFPAVLGLAVLVDWFIRRPTMMPLLAGLERVPPADRAGRRSLYRLRYGLPAIGGLIALVLPSIRSAHRRGRGR